MDRRTFLDQSAREGVLLTATPFALAGKTGGAQSGGTEDEAYPNFHALPIYRCYLRGANHGELPESLLEDLSPPCPVDLARELDNRRDRRAVAAYSGGQKLGYLAREDHLLLDKLVRRGVPVVCRLIGVQPDEGSSRRFSVEVALLYPPNPRTDLGLNQSETDRLEGLAEVGAKPSHTLRPSADPLSARHVHEGYFGAPPVGDPTDVLAKRAWNRRTFLG